MIHQMIPGVLTIHRKMTPGGLIYAHDIWQSPAKFSASATEGFSDLIIRTMQDFQRQGRLAGWIADFSECEIRSAYGPAVLDEILKKVLPVFSKNMPLFVVVPPEGKLPILLKSQVLRFATAITPPCSFQIANTSEGAEALLSQVRP